MPSSLPRSAPADQRVDPAAILSFLDAVEARPDVEMHSLMVVRHGRVVAEGWWAPYSAERPLGIGHVGWHTFPPGREQGFSGLHARTEDVAKLGQLYLRGGRWEGAQLIPAQWVASPRPCGAIHRSPPVGSSTCIARPRNGERRRNPR
jgi:CubicO group peptidase (beta-lactamase class C family)